MLLPSQWLSVFAARLQLSSGIFNHLKDSVLSNIRQEPTPDLQPDTLNTLSALMLAQAQDCFCRKAMAGRLAHKILVHKSGTKRFKMHYVMVVTLCRSVTLLVKKSYFFKVLYTDRMLFGAIALIV